MQTYKVRGNSYWAKILGAPKKAYNPKEREWSLDLALDKEGVKILKDLGLAPKVKKDRDYSPHIKFVRSEFKKGGPNIGQPNPPIDVKDVSGKPWDQESLIGNGSMVEVEFSTYETEFSGKKFIKPAILGVTVLKHVPYIRPDDNNNNDNIAEESWTP